MFPTFLRRKPRPPEPPWTCSECGQQFPADDARRHRNTHRAFLISREPLIVELRFWDSERELAPAIAELKRLFPGRRFQLLPGAIVEGIRGGLAIRTILAIDDDWTIPHDPFGPV